MEEGALSVMLKLLAVLGLVLANGFFVAAEFSLVSVRRSRVDQLVAEGKTGAKRLQNAVENLDSHLAATQLGITISSLGLGWIGEPALAALLEPIFAVLPWGWFATHTFAVIIAFTVITTMHIVVGELMPKSLALQRSEMTALATAGPLRIFLAIFWLAIFILNGLGNYLLRRIGLRPGSGEELLHSTEELKMLVSASHDAGVLHTTQQEVVNRVFSLKTQKIGSYLTPRTEIDWLDLGANPETWRLIATESEHSRLPVANRLVTEVIGIVRAKDVLLAADLDVTTLERMAEAWPMIVLRESTPVLSGFEQLRATGKGIAIVVDEYGDLLGVITLSDLLEAFVGDLPEAYEVTEMDDDFSVKGSRTLDGSLPIEEVKRILSLRELTPLAGTSYYTLAGFVIELLRTLPRTGDRVIFENFSFEVTKMDGFRIDQIAVTPERKT